MADLLRILLVEDDMIDRMNVKRACKSFKVPVELSEAKCAKDGLALLKDNEFDCVLLDFSLPDLDGLAFLKEAQKVDKRKTAIVMLTGFADESLALKMVGNGAQDYLVKGEVKSGFLHRIVQYAIERKKSANHLLEKESKLAQTEKMAAVGTLMAGLAHNLNNPLMGLSGLFQMLQKEITETGAATINKEIGLQVLDLVNRMAGIISDMQNVSRTQNVGQHTVSNLNHIAENAVRYAKNFIAHQKISFDLSIEEDVYVMCNTLEIEQAVIHILNNAVDAIGDEGAISVVVDDVDHVGILKIVDNGKGIDKDNLSKIFDPFFSTKTGVAARGLSMSLVERFISRNNAAIDIDSTVGVGTTMTIKLPCCTDEEVKSAQLLAL